jgi:hypothetical protein
MVAKHLNETKWKEKTLLATTPPKNIMHIFIYQRMF